MNKNLSQFECLPNEILLEIFQYFNAQHLFQLFYNLNSRLNTLIKSFHHLNLLYHMQSFTDNQIDDKHFFPYYLHTLLVGRAININLHHFANIHCLKLECPLQRVLAQLNSDILPHLKHLSITHFDTLITIAEGTSLPSLHSLKVSRITSSVYRSILTVCPNLVYFQLSIFSSDQLSCDIEKHLNLKRLIIDIVDMIWPWNDDVFDGYLSCVPNVEIFLVYRSIFISKMNEFSLEYDWLTSKIDLHFSSLRRFQFFFQIIQSQVRIELNTDNILCQIKDLFSNKHQNRYQSRLIIYE